MELVKGNKLTSFVDLFNESKVIVSKEIKENMLKMFSSQQILEAKLLYVASLHNFSTQKFHELCENIPHTLTLCQTEHGKIIGGYTPLVWGKSNNYLRDESGESFIFSLTNNHKFTVDKSNVAIYQHISEGPYFGDSHPDLYISSNANTCARSWSKINRSYSNENYMIDSE